MERSPRGCGLRDFTWYLNRHLWPTRRGLTGGIIAGGSSTWRSGICAGTASCPRQSAFVATLAGSLISRLRKLDRSTPGPAQSLDPRCQHRARCSAMLAGSGVGIKAAPLPVPPLPPGLPGSRRHRPVLAQSGRQRLHEVLRAGAATTGAVPRRTHRRRLLPRPGQRHHRS